MKLTFNEYEYEIVNFSLIITKDNETSNFIERIDCSLIDLNTDLEILAQQINNEFQGTFNIINGDSIYNFEGYGFDDLRFFVDNIDQTKSISFSKVLNTML